MDRMEPIFREMVAFFKGDPEQIQHSVKVYGFARMIGIAEGIDERTQEILEIAAILHDIGVRPAREKYQSSAGKFQEIEGPVVAKEILKRLGLPETVIERVCYLIGHHHTYTHIDGVDYQILVEADFLVNMYEGRMSEEAIRTTFDKIFVTRTGKQYGQKMFAVGDPQ